MKVLQAPSSPPPFIETFVAIRDSMQDGPNSTRARLTGRYRAINSCYVSLEASIALSTLSTLKPSAYLSPLSSDFEVAYTGNSKPLRILKKRIKEVQATSVLTVCPLCKISLPRTFDHYLPLGTFPEFAVHPLNLVPSCSTCNSKKLEAWLNENGERICLYLYSDIIPQIPFIRCSLTPDRPDSRNIGVIFSLERPNGLRRARWNSIVRHFERLGLIDRYNEIGNDELSEVFGSARDFLDNGGPRNRVRGFLRSGAGRFAAVHGVSYWRAALRSQVAASRALFTWLGR
jgi:hypothetical protein